VVVSALLMLRRFARTVREASKDEQFVPVFGAGVSLLVLGTVVYAIGGGWSVLDAFYFAVATLTTSSVADPELVLEDPWLKVFTAFYVLIGIGIFVALVGRLGLAFVALSQQDRARKQAAKAGDDERL
jgi:hypothetical protein